MGDKVIARVCGALVALVVFASVAVAQTEAILPNGMTQFSDGNGVPYAGGRVYMYIPHTTTPKATFQDPLGATPNANPIALDANGRAIIWGNGEYREVVQDLYGNVVWDQLTYASPAGTSGGSGGVLWYGTATGTANAITLSTPAGFVATDGQTVGFIANATNTASATINASGYGSVLVEKNTSTGPAQLVGGEIVLGNLEFATYSASLNAFILQALLPTPGIGAQTVINAAATTDLGTIASHDVIVSGTTGITSFGSSATTQWPLYLVQFGGALTITESAALLTPNDANITTATGDSAWALYLGSGDWQIIQYMPVAALPYVPASQFRLSTSSTSPISAASGTGVGTVYAQPYSGNFIPLWNGTYFVPTPCPVLSNILANSATGNAGPAAAVAASVYDLVAWNNAGTCTLTRDVVWGSSSSRTDAYARVDGILVNSVAITNGPGIGYGTYLGTIVTDASGATVTFNPTPAAASGGPSGGAWVGLWNENNRVPVGLTAQDNKASWVYSTSTWRQSDNSANNRVTAVAGQQEDFVVASFADTASITAPPISLAIGIGVNSTTTPSGVTPELGGVNGATIQAISGTAVCKVLSSLGVSYYQALEWASGADGTFLGKDNTTIQVHQVSADLRY
jgi:hypothetical protein